MKPFDLEAAKNGAPIVTRDGRAVQEFHHFVTERTEYPCCAIINGEVSWHAVDGSTTDDRRDLFMVATKRTVWVNLYKSGTCYHFRTKEAAESHSGFNEPDLAIAVPVEIEE
jgi:hypothetical protein